jgi:hypothetical protein
MASLIFGYKLAFQNLQLIILEGDLKETDNCFKELEKQFDKFEKLGKYNMQT